MARPNKATFEKRRRERLKAEKREEKRERKERRKAEKKAGVQGSHVGEELVMATDPMFEQPKT